MQEFKAFASKGNVVDLVVGVIIGGAFGKIVTSLVTNVLMPPIGLLIGGIDFTHAKLVLKHAAPGSGEVAIGYGLFLQSAVDFLIIAAALFLIIQLINRAKRRESVQNSDENKLAPAEDISLLREIRDLLKKSDTPEALSERGL